MNNTSINHEVLRMNVPLELGRTRSTNIQNAVTNLKELIANNPEYIDTTIDSMEAQFRTPAYAEPQKTVPVQVVNQDYIDTQLAAMEYQFEPAAQMKVPDVSQNTLTSAMNPEMEQLARNQVGQILEGVAEQNLTQQLEEIDAF